ncbi:MoaD/ThiS family protein [Mesorhizobium sp. M0751]|uniref:MoaD/ThiS family protein n=1 Tax=unclassified Mesorhizobium TaxID=325217 RepID=UPI00333B7FBC
MVEVTLWGSLGAAAGGKNKVEIEAKDIRELFRKLAEQYPGLEPLIDRGIAVAIDGTIYRDTWSKELPKGRKSSCCRGWRGDELQRRCHVV